MEQPAPAEGAAPGLLDGRVQQAIFLRTAGLRLRLPQSAIAVATVLMHKFYAALPTASSLNPDVVVTSALYLAAKAEECTRKVRDVIHVVHYGRHKQPMQVDEDFWTLRREVLVVEQAICRALNFDYDIQTAYPYVLTLAHSISASAEFVQLCCTFLNDSLLLPSYLDHPVVAHAAAAIHFAGAVVGQRLPGDDADMKLGYPASQLRWWQTFGVSLPEIESMCCAVVRLWGDTHEAISCEPLTTKVENSVQAPEVPTEQPPTTLSKTV